MKLNNINKEFLLTMLKVFIISTFLIFVTILYIRKCNNNDVDNIIDDINNINYHNNDTLIEYVNKYNQLVTRTEVLVIDNIKYLKKLQTSYSTINNYKI